MNAFFTAVPRLPLWACVALLASAAHAQTPPAATDEAPGRPSSRVERITHEDALARVDELRVGGETKSIEVQPKNGLPGYQITPAQGGENLSEGWGQRGGSTGKSSWRVLSF
ncbi:hypothetical protein [Hydrogenophaga sp.]|uniref:hypothetical protein n=1 Tax=Hydrogenophaga sp. TaxID=1904254 RepID=UPI003567B55A